MSDLTEYKTDLEEVFPFDRGQWLEPGAARKGVSYENGKLGDIFIPR